MEPCLIEHFIKPLKASKHNLMDLERKKNKQKKPRHPDMTADALGTVVEHL